MNRYSTLKTRTPLRAKKPWRPVRKAPPVLTEEEKKMLQGSRMQTRGILKARKKNALKRGGSFIPKETRAKMQVDPEYTRCSLQNVLPDLIGPCDGRVTREHAMIYAGSKVQERWAIIPCCAKHHGVDQFQDGPGEAPKEVRMWVALNRATEDELRAISKAVDYIARKRYLNEKYGQYIAPPIPLIPKQK